MTHDWLTRYAQELSRQLEGEVDLAREHNNKILELARIVAHGTERKNAPLAAFIAGRYVSARVAEGQPADIAVEEAVAVADGLLPHQ